MGHLITLLALVLAAEEKPANKAETAADLITLRDGKVVRGLILESPPRTGLLVVVRREWARAEVPDLARRWETEEKPLVRRANAQRRTRLEAWRRERKADADPRDRINAWILKELDALKAADAAPSTPLMLVTLSRSNVRGIVDRPAGISRLLRLGWKLGLKDVETLPLDSVKDAVEARGFLVDGRDVVSIESLLPNLPEPEPRWLARRAATEVLNDPGLRFVRFQSFVMPEPEPGQAADLGTALSAIQDLKRLLDDQPRDPLAEKFAGISARGRVGAVLTQTDLDPTLERATAQLTLWICQPNGRWAPFGNRSATIRPADLNENAGNDLADDPQVQAAFRILEGLGVGEVPADVKRKSLNVGQAVRVALGTARSAFQDDLNALAFPIESAPAAGEKPVKERKP